MNYNRIILVGRMVADPELKYTPSGIAVSQFRLAVNRPISKEAQAQGTQEQADFIDISTWRQSAEYAAQYLSKGRLVLVEGRLQIREYVDKEGQKRKAAEVVADNIKGLDKRGEGEGGEGGGGAGYGGGNQGGQSYGGGGGGRGEYDQTAQAPARQAAPQAAPAARGGYAGGTGNGGGGYSGGNNGAARGARPAPAFDDSASDGFDDPFAE